MENRENKGNKTAKTKVLMVASEAMPFVATGGLGEVMGSLPEALINIGKGVDVRVALPFYSDVDEKYRKKMKLIGSCTIDLAWRKQYVGLFMYRHKGVCYYFIDNEYYFKRDRGLYGYYDDCERYAFFAKAVLDCIPMMDFEPQIIHAHDWQTAMAVVYQSAMDYYPLRKTVFTVHNIEYQGKYGKEVVDDILGIPESKTHLVEYGGATNLMKGAIEAAHQVTTVSPSYAMELQEPMVARGLDETIAKNQGKLIGILNGIDTRVYDPWTDDYIYAKYSVTAPARKKRNKLGLQKQMGLPLREKTPILAMVTRLVEHKGIDLILEYMERLLWEEEIQWIVLGSGDKVYEDFFKGMAEKYPDKVAVDIAFDYQLSHRIYAGADMLMMPSKNEPCGLAQMIACRYGTVPIVRETGGLRDSIRDCSLGKGEGFVFKRYDGEDFYNGIKRALGLYSCKDDWKKLMIHDMRINFSWNASAKKYVDMYRALIKR